MAVIKRSNGTYQVKYRGSDGFWVTKTHPTKRDAELFDQNLKRQKRSGTMLLNEGKNLTLDEYVETWFETIRTGSPGWRKIQRQLYRDFIQPILGRMKLTAIQPQTVTRVLNRMAEMGKAPTTRCHVFVMLRKMFRDAIETFQLVTFNPVLRSFKPRISTSVARHLNLGQVRVLLSHVRGKPYGAAIWIQFFLGLRVGELQALRWEDVDLDVRVIYIRRTYSKHDKMFKEYPKGRRQHSKPIPPELFEIFGELGSERGPKELVLRSPNYHMLSYEWFNRQLGRYCKALGLPIIGTHGLRHSTSSLYLSNGASKEDIRTLMAHSSDRVTERYVHHNDTKLDRVAKVIRLFPEGSGSSRSECSQNVPKSKADSEGGA